MNLSLLLEMASSTLDDRTAVVSGDVSLSYAELDAAARRVAGKLVEDGAAGLVYCGTNDASFPIALFGAAYAGVPFIPLNYRLGDEQLAPLVEANSGSMIVAEGGKVAGADPGVTASTAASSSIPPSPPPARSSCRRSSTPTTSPWCSTRRAPRARRRRPCCATGTSRPT